MKKLMMVCTLLLGLSLAYAAVKPGENLLLNPQLENDAIDQATGRAPLEPNLWARTGYYKAISYKVNGSPSGKGAVCFFSPDPNVPTPEVTLRQSALSLVAGETYKISALVRTKDFYSPHCGLTVYPNGWTDEVGIKVFPANQDWTPMSAEFKMLPSSNNSYTFAAFACDYKGSLEFADLRLEAVSDKALAGSKISELGSALADPHLTPWTPLLNSIPIPKKGFFDFITGEDWPEMTFRFFGKLPNGTTNDDYIVKYVINGKLEGSTPLTKAFVILELKGYRTPGDFELAVSIVERKSGKAIYERKHTATLIEVPSVSTTSHKRLNNLVIEILNKSLKKNEAEQNFEFCTTRNGWIFIAAQNAAAPNIEVILDGKLTVINANTPKLETFRDIPMGGHTLTVKGATYGGTIIVRSIPEIYNYCPGANSMVTTNPPYDWEFQKKYVLSSVTTQNGGNIPEAERKAFFDAGYKWIANAGTTRISSEGLVKTLTTCAGMTSPNFNGVSCDEQFFNDITTILPYTIGLRNFTPTNDHVVYTWITSEPTMTGLHHDFMAECLNTSHGNGRLITEVYCRSCPTLQAANEYLDSAIIQRANRYRTFYPNVINKWGIILGNFNQVPILSLAHHPNVDYKYYLDLQFNIIANNPECKDMGITGYWGSYYADHELHRWAFMLTRHYCVEGKKTMLSDEYGFSYDPSHIKNGDFTPNFNNWNVIGNVTAGYHKDFGSRGQNRWGGNNGQGDTFAVFTKKDNEVSSVTQTAKNLVPGKFYCLQFFTVDYNDVKADKIAPRKFALEAHLSDGVEIDQKESWTFVDERIKGRYAHNNGVARGNLHHIVFKATKPEVTITIDNAKAAKGEALGLNYVMVNPFLPVVE